MDCARRSSVLVIDDDPDLLRAYARILMGAGHQVQTASGGASGVAHLKQRPFEAIVSDVAMPGVDGLQVLQAAREHDRHTPVLLITAGPSLATAVQALEHGAFRYLQKPVSSEVLQEQVSNAIAHSRAARDKQEVLDESSQATRQADERTQLGAQFQSALDKLWIAYQPIVQWSTRRTYAHEALARSKEPTLPHPGALFDAAERLGQVQALGRSIRTRAPAPMGKTDSLLFVNLNTLELEDEELYSSQSPLLPLAHRIVLEVTERASLDSVKDVETKMAVLRQMGFRIAIDDIGAGYSGLSSFAVLEPDIVKLDMSLVRDVHSSVTKQKLIRSMTTLCEGLGVLVVAEGVETTQELNALLDLGCDYFQGYLFARPGPPFPAVDWASADA